MKNSLFFIIYIILGTAYLDEHNYSKKNFIYFNVIGSKIKTMDTIYYKEYDNVKISFLRTENTTTVNWETLLTNKSGENITLFTDKVEKNMLWKSQEEKGESPIRLYNISGFFFDGDNLYLVYNRFGFVTLIKYTFTNNNKFTKEEKPLLSYLVSGGFGDMINNVQFKKINGDLYFLLITGQSFTGSTSNLYKSNLVDLNLKKIEFDEKVRIVKAISLSESGRLGFEQTEGKIKYYNSLNNSKKDENKLIAPTDKELKEYKIVQEYIKLPFYFKEISSQKDKYEIEETELDNLGLAKFSLFTDESRKIEELKIKDAIKYINQATNLLKTDKPSNMMNLLDYFHDSIKENKLYFFCQDGFKIKIIRYDNFYNQFVIGDYKEEIVKLEK